MLSPALNHLLCLDFVGRTKKVRKLINSPVVSLLSPTCLLVSSVSCCVYTFFSLRVFLLSITDWSWSDVLILYSSCQFFWNSSIMCSEPGKLVIVSYCLISQRRSYSFTLTHVSCDQRRIPSQIPCFWIPMVKWCNGILLWSKIEIHGFNSRVSK